MKASIIIRSYNRLFALAELLKVLLQQDYDLFEIIVIEQSTIFSKEEERELLNISSDKKIRILKKEPLGGPAARNEGVKNASGEILIFIDDDDLPASKDWITKHVEAYSDKSLAGFTGRHLFNGNSKCPYVPWIRWYIRKKAMSYNFMKFPLTFAQFDEDVRDVEWLHGTNSSIRKEWVLKTSLWDTDVMNQDEHSFAFKLHPFLKNGYRLDFRKEPAVIRRMDIQGGMAKRSFSLQKEWINQYDYLKKILYKYNPKQRFLFPLHLLYIAFKTLKLRF